MKKETIKMLLKECSEGIYNRIDEYDEKFVEEILSKECYSDFSEYKNLPLNELYEKVKEIAEKYNVIF